MDSPPNMINDALNISVGKGDTFPPPPSSIVAAEEQNKLSLEGTTTAADRVDQDEETLSIPTSEEMALQQDPPEEVRSCTSCPIDVDTCSPWEQFDEDFKSLPTDSARKQMDVHVSTKQNRSKSNC